MNTQITAGSHSRLNIFETCKLRAKLAFIDKIPEPERPPRPDGKEEPMARGSRIHDSAEAYIKGETEILIPELAKYFEAEFNAARDMFADGKAQGEESWNFDENWQELSNPFDSDPPDWDVFHQIRFRIKTDLTVFKNDKETLIVDYKTGKKYGNDVAHYKQLELYAIGGYLLHPNTEKMTCELWYTDINDITSITFTKTEALSLLKDWDTRNKTMMSCNEFPPNPTKDNCKWCPYKITGDCTVAI